MYTIRRFFAFLVLLALSGCNLLDDNEPQGVFLDTNSNAFMIDDEVELALVNRSSLSLTTHPELCNAILEVQTLEGWAISFIEEGRVCTDIGFELKPGGILRTLRTIDAELDEGIYRYTLTVVIPREGKGPGVDNRFEFLELSTEPFGVFVPRVVALD